MTIAEMHKEFRFLLDKNDTFQFPNLLEAEIDRLFNIALERVIKQKLYQTNYRKTGFEREEKRRKDLAPLVREVSYTLSDVNYDDIKHAYTVTYDQLSVKDNYWYTVKLALRYQNQACKDFGYYGIYMTTHDDFTSVMDNWFYRPSVKSPVALEYDYGYDIYTGEKIDTTVITPVLIFTYIKKPALFVFSTGTYPDLPDSVHRELVQEAVKVALETLEQPRQQTFENIIKTSE
jgi:hypothetical protein